MSSTGGLSGAVLAKSAAGRPAAAATVPAAPPAVTRDEVDVLVRRAGLNLNAGQKADLAVSYQHIVALTARIPRARPIWDEPCFTPAFGAGPPPAPTPAPTPAPSPAATPARTPPKAKPAAKTAAKPAARAARPAKPAAKAGRAKPAKTGARPPGKPARKAARPRR